MTTPTLSVVISLCNQVETLERAVTSILRNSGVPNELIIVDDGSTDGGGGRAAELAAANANIRLIVLEEHEGYEKSINLGIESAYHDFIFCLSASDTVRPGYLERALSQLERHPHVGLFCGDGLCLDPDLELRVQRPPLPERIGHYAPEQLATRLRGGAIDFHAAVFRRGALLECGGLSSRLGSLSRWFLSLAVAYRFGLVYQPGPAYLSEDPNRLDGLGPPVRDFERAVEIRRAIDMLKLPQFRDLLSPFCRSAAFAFFGNGAADAVMEDPESWDSVTLMLLRECTPATEVKRSKKEWRGPLADFYAPRNLQSRIDSLLLNWTRSGKRIAIWGAGRSTLALFRLTRLANAHIVGILDLDPDRGSGDLEFGFEVLEPSALGRLEPDILLVPGDEPAGEIREALQRLGVAGLKIVHVCEPSGEVSGWQAPLETRTRISNTSLYGVHRSKLIPRVRQLVESWRQRRRRVAIYGAGRITTDLFRWTNIREARLVAIVDPIVELQGHRIWGLEVMAPERLPCSNADTVLVCAEDFARLGSSELLRLGIAGLDVEMLFPPVGTTARLASAARFEPLPLV